MQNGKMAKKQKFTKSSAEILGARVDIFMHLKNISNVMFKEEVLSLTLIFKQH